MRLSFEWVDERDGRNRARLVRHGDDIYIETEGNHDGTVVCTAVRIARVKFVSGIKFIGGIFE